MRNIIKNKKGDKLLSVYWFAILFIVAAAVSYMVISFYGSPYDVRELEANTLTNKIAGCLTEGPYLKDSLTDEFRDNFLEECGINFDVEDIYNWREQGQYYTEARVFEFEDGREIFSMSEGNVNLKEFCGLEGRGIPVCLERSFYALDEEGNQYRINIASIVRKTEKNA